MQAQKEGRLVLFVGAGVSVADPSSLPLFGGLADRVDDRLGMSTGGTPEERLQELADRELNVHAVVREIILESVAPNAAHEAVAALAMAGSAVRVVTTNYDRHLSECLSDGISDYASPDLPGSEDFSGVVHIHGSIAHEPDRLVVTKDDFARAYMQQNSPTLLFLQRLFASEVVLFVGYSLKDTLIDYIVRAATGKGRLFALTDKPDESRWNELDVLPVAYRSHDELPAALTEWARRASASYEEHDRRVARIVSGRVEGDALTPQDESYLADVVSDPDLVRIFTRHARGPVWFRWIAEGPGEKLFKPSAELGPAEMALVSWFLRHYDDDDTATEVLRLIVGNGGRLHEILWLNLAMTIDPRGGVSRETSSRMLLLLAEVAPAGLDEFGHLVRGLLRHCETPLDDEVFLELAYHAWSPKVRPVDSYLLPFGLWGPFEVACTDPHSYSQQPPYDPDMLSRRSHLAADLLSIVDGHLRRVCRISDIAGNPDPFGGRQAIEDHPQNHSWGSVDFLVDMARDLWEILAQDMHLTAIGYLQSWEASSWTVFNRLAIHGWIQRADVSPEEKIGWLLERDGWVSCYGLHHEAMRLIAETAANASEARIEMLIDQITADPESAGTGVVYNRLGWIARHAPRSVRAQTAFAEAKKAHPDFDMVEHPDLLWWSSSSFGPLPPEWIEGLSPQDLVDTLLAEPTGAVAVLLDHAVTGVPFDQSRYEWHRVLRSVHEATSLSSDAGLALLEALVDDPASKPEARQSLASSVLMELTNQESRVQTVNRHRAKIRPLVERVWDAGTAHWNTPTRASSESGWYTAAMNTWPGNLTELMIVKIAMQIEADPEIKTALDGDDGHLLAKITTGDSAETSLAQVMCARHLTFLYAADAAWTRQHILPMLDPAEDEERALRCWDAFLCDRSWSPQLLDDGLRRHFVAFAGHVHKCHHDAQLAFSRLAVDLCLSPDASDATGPPPWLAEYSANGTAATAASFISATAEALRDADAGTRTAEWHRWMHTHWQQRLSGIPRKLTREEASTLVDWALLLDDDFPTAVDLVVQSPASLQGSRMLSQLMFETRSGAGRLVRLLDLYPDATVRLIAHLLKHTDQEAAQNWQLGIIPLINELEPRATGTTFQPLREQVLRLGWNDTHSDSHLDQAAGGD